MNFFPIFFILIAFIISQSFTKPTGSDFTISTHPLDPKIINFTYLEGESVGLPLTFEFEDIYYTDNDIDGSTGTPRRKPVGPISDKKPDGEAKPEEGAGGGGKKGAGRGMGKGRGMGRGMSKIIMPSKPTDVESNSIGEDQTTTEETASQHKTNSEEMIQTLKDEKEKADENAETTTVSIEASDSETTSTSENLLGVNLLKTIEDNLDKDHPDLSIATSSDSDSESSSTIKSDEDAVETTENPEETTENPSEVSTEATNDNESTTESESSTTDDSDATTDESTTETGDKESTEHSEGESTTEQSENTTEGENTTEESENTTESTTEQGESTAEDENTTEQAEHTTEEAGNTTEVAENTTEEAENTTENDEKTTEEAGHTTEDAENTTEAEHTTEESEHTTEDTEHTTEEAEHTTENAENSKENAEHTTEEETEHTTEEAENSKEATEHTTEEEAEHTTEEASSEQSTESPTTESEILIETTTDLSVDTAKEFKIEFSMTEKSHKPYNITTSRPKLQTTKVLEDADSNKTLSYLKHTFMIDPSLNHSIVVNEDLTKEVEKMISMDLGSKGFKMILMPNDTEELSTKPAEDTLSFIENVLMVPLNESDHGENGKWSGGEGDSNGLSKILPDHKKDDSSEEKGQSSHPDHIYEYKELPIALLPDPLGKRPISQSNVRNSVIEQFRKNQIFEKIKSYEPNIASVADPLGRLPLFQIRDKKEAVDVAEDGKIKITEVIGSESESNPGLKPASDGKTIFQRSIGQDEQFDLSFIEELQNQNPDEVSSYLDEIERRKRQNYEENLLRNGYLLDSKPYNFGFDGYNSNGPPPFTS